MKYIWNFTKKSLILLGYCSPAIVALAITVPAYHKRTVNIAQEIQKHGEAIRDQDEFIIIDAETEIPPKEKMLKEYFLRSKQSGNLQEKIDVIGGKIHSIWLRYSIFICIMTLLPFALLGIKVAFRYNRKDITLKDRIASIRGSWWMKFALAFAMTTGWLYTVNPEGRGGSTLAEYINTQDIFTNTTLPGFILSPNIPLVVAGFVGWYLNLVSYFISKLYYDDVYGTRVYRFLVGKLLFVYGISLVLSSVEMEQGNMAMFLVGYFPLTALSILKEYGMKAMQGGSQEKGSLVELPTISRSQILRLHEEGIENITTLAAYPRIAELKKYQYAIAPMVDIWVDSARLYTIIGQEKALKVKEFCSTASEFLRNYKLPKFRKTLLDEYQIKNPDEINRLLRETFHYDEELMSIKPEGSSKKRK
ncbi:MAG: hypothetical protein ABUK01_09410 [Leptospirales bacterium]